MSLDEKFIDDFCKKSPNAKRAKNGILLETTEGVFHITNFISTEEHDKIRHKYGQGATSFMSYCNESDIARIMKPQSSSDLLLKLRAEAILDNPRLMRVFQSRKGKKKNWSLSKYYSRRVNEEKYLENLSKGNRKKLSSIPAGSAYIDSANAMCIKTEYGNIIAISEPLENFLYFMNIFFYGEDFGVSQDDLSAAYVIAQRIMAGHESFDFDLDPRARSLPFNIENFMRECTNLQYQFILGHEYSHHLLGHLDTASLMSIKKEKLTIKHYKHSHKLEYDADWYSIKHIKGNSSYRENIANSAFLTLMYFDVSRMVQKHINPSSRQSLNTHPTPENRIFKLRSRLNNRYGFPHENLKNNIKYFREYTEYFLKEILPYNYDMFEGYGSIYLPSYTDKILQDRVDF